MELDEICPEPDYHLIVAMSDVARSFRNEAAVFPFLGIIPLNEVRWGRAVVCQRCPPGGGGFVMLLEETQLRRATYRQVVTSTADAMDAYDTLDQRTLVVFCISLLVRRSDESYFPRDDERGEEGHIVMVLLNRFAITEKWVLTLLDSNHTSSDPEENRSRLELMQYLIVRAVPHFKGLIGWKEHRWIFALNRTGVTAEGGGVCFLSACADLLSMMQSQSARNRSLSSGREFVTEGYKNAPASVELLLNMLSYPGQEKTHPLMPFFRRNLFDQVSSALNSKENSLVGWGFRKRRGICDDEETRRIRNPGPEFSDTVRKLREYRRDTSRSRSRNFPASAMVTEEPRHRMERPTTPPRRGSMRPTTPPRRSAMRPTKPPRTRQLVAEPSRPDALRIGLRQLES
jgi:hypothetical protein